MSLQPSRERNLVRIGSTCWLAEFDWRHRRSRAAPGEHRRPDRLWHWSVIAAHAPLARTGRLPSLHQVDTGYPNSRVLVESRREYGVTVMGRVSDDPSWPARSGTDLTKAEFVVDRAARLLPVRLANGVSLGCHTGIPRLA
jgi:hypothetical protein